MRQQLLVFISFLLCVLSVVSIVINPITNGKTYDVLSCQRLYFEWTITNPPPRYYISVNISSSNVSSGARLSLTDVKPTDSENTNDCVKMSCNVLTGQTACQIDSCLETSTVWYLWVEHQLPTASDITIYVEVNPIPTSQKLNIDSSFNSPTSSRYKLYDFYYVVIDNSTPSPPGTVLLIDVDPNNATLPNATIYINYGDMPAFPEGACTSALPGVGSITIAACPFSQGGTYQITVQRSTPDQEYKISLTKKPPTIVSISDSSPVEYKFYKPGDVVYFSYNQLSSSSVVEFVVDNIFGGILDVAANNRYLPYSDCALSPKKCSTTGVGCHIYYEPCETDDTINYPWYFYVSATSFNLEPEPLVFTVRAITSPNPITPIGEGVAIGQVLRGAYAHYQYTGDLQSGDWLRIHTYIDASSLSVPDLEGYLFVSNSPFAGIGNCYTYRKYCQLRPTSQDVKSCSIQIDSCELNQDYSNGIYFSIYATDKNDYYHFQEFVSYTVETILLRPSSSHKLSVGNDGLPHIVTQSVSQGQYQIFRIDSASSAIDVTVSAGDDSGVGSDLSVEVFFGASLSAPSCPCWDADQSYTVNYGAVTSFTLNTCDIQEKAQNGLYIVVGGNTNTDYEERKFVISIASSLDISPIASADLGVGSSGITDIYETPKIYKLFFDRNNLDTRDLLLTFRAHPSSTLRTQLFAYPPFTSQITCSTGEDMGTCNSADDPRSGYCTILVKSCDFTSADDQRTFVAFVSGTTLTQESISTYQISIDVIDNSPMGLSFNSPYASSVYAEEYHHYYVNVPDGAYGNQVLIVEAYFDAGELVLGEGYEMHMYVNTPSQNRNAGDSDDCLCNEAELSDSYKVVYVVNPCDLKVGNYHFGIKTIAPTYDTFPTQYTILARLQTLSLGTAEFDEVKDLSLFPQQFGVYTLNLPDSFFDDPTDTEKIVTIRVYTTRTADAIYGTISSDDPSTCNCVSPLYSFTTIPSPDGKTEYSFQFDYCRFTSSKTWYLTLEPVSYMDSNNPVPFSVEFKKHNVAGVNTLSVTKGTCSSEAGSSVPFHTVITENILYFSLNYNGAATGDEVVYIRFDNVTDGAISLFFKEDNLPTPQCTNIAPKTCPPDCLVQTPCSNQVKYLGVKAIATKADVAVSFKISACISSFTDINLNGAPTLATLAKNSSIIYRFSMSSAKSTNFAFVAELVAHSTLSLNSTLNIIFSITQSVCSACGGFQKPIIGCTGNCSIPITGCEFPSNFAETPFVAFINNLSPLSDIDYSLTISTYTLPSPTALTTGSVVSSTVSPKVWQVFSWTPSSSEVSKPEVVNTELIFNFTSTVPNIYVMEGLSLSDASCLDNRVIPPAGPFLMEVTRCCSNTDPRYVAIFNYDQNSASFDIAAKVDVQTSTSSLNWNSNSDGSGSATGTITVPAYDPDRYDPILGEPAPGLFVQEVVVHYPGSSSVSLVDATIYIDTANTTINVHTYINPNGFAGNGACFGSSYDTTTYPYFVQIFGCALVPDLNTPQVLYLGFQNSDQQSHDFNVNAVTHTPTTVSLGTPLQVSFTNDIDKSAIVHQYEISSTVSPAPFRQLTIKVTTATETLQLYVNDNGYAGNAPPCLNNVATGTATPGNPFTYNINLCPAFSAQTNFFLGVMATTKNDTINTDFTIDLEETDPGTQNATRINFPGTTSVNPVSTTSFYIMDLPTDGAPDGSFYYASIKVNGLNNPTLTELQYAHDGTCSPFDTFHCAENFTMCTSLIYPCYYRAGEEYHINLQAPVQTDSLSIETSRTQIPVVELTLPSSRNTYEIEDSISSQEIKMYKITVDGPDILPDETIEILLTSVTCGSIEVYINKDYSAGPNCNRNTGNIPCTAACTLVEVSTCDELFSDVLGVWYISVRGLDQLNYPANSGADVPARYSIAVVRSGGVVMDELHPNEVGSFYAIPQVLPNSTCPAYTPPSFPQCGGCSSTVSGDYPYVYDPRMYIYPLDGAVFIDNEVLTFSKYVYLGDIVLSDATIYIQTEIPTFCPPVSSSVSDTCSLTSTVSTCSIVLDRCKYKGFRQIFIIVDNVVFNGPDGDVYHYNDNPSSIKIAEVTLTQTVSAVLDVSFSTTSQYLLFTLAQGEREYIRVNHDPNYANTPNYLFSSNLIRLSEDAVVEFYNTWDSCTTTTNLPFCSQSGFCKDTFSSGQCLGTSDPPCTDCDFKRFTCQPDYDSLHSYFFIYARDAGPDGIVVGKIEFNFTVERYPIKSTCDEIDARTSGTNTKFYVPGVSPGDEQIYHYTFTHLTGQGTLQLGISEDSLVVPDSSDSCAEYVFCQTTGLSTCVLSFRRNSEKDIYLGVIAEPSPTTTQNFIIIEEALNVNPVQLSNNSLTDLTTLELDNVTGCIYPHFTEYFKYTASSEMLLVELWDEANVWVNTNHVTYRYGMWTCSTGGGYCQILIACGGASNKYYFHVPHTLNTGQIRVTEMDVPKISLSLASTTQVTLNGNFPTSYEISGVNPSSDPSIGLFLSYDIISGVKTWVTRGSFGDSTCGIQIPPSYNLKDIVPKANVVPGCRIVDKTDTYYVNFIYTGELTCNAQTIFIRADLETRSLENSNTQILVPTTSQATLQEGHTSRMEFDVSLDSETVIYTRFSQVLYGKFDSVYILKGHVTIPDDPYVVPTDASGSCPACYSSLDPSQTDFVGWYDDCWHCSAIDTVYLDVTAGTTALQRTGIDYNVSVSTPQWTPLTDSPTNFDLPGPTLSYAFFTVDVSANSGSVVKVTVTSGAAAVMTVFPRDCTERALVDNIVQVCLLNGECSLFTAQSNMANLTGQLRIVLSGEEVKGHIVHLSGAELCTSLNSDDSPFCSGIIGTSYGDGETFDQKDLRAQVVYNEIFGSFSSRTVGGCASQTLSQDCINNIKTFACEIAYPGCSSEGFAVPPEYTTCTNVQNSCGANFEDVALDKYQCNHNFYNGGVKWVSAGDNDNPITIVTAPSSDDLLPLWIVLGILGFIIILIAIICLIRKGQGDGDYNMQQQPSS